MRQMGHTRRYRIVRKLGGRVMGKDGGTPDMNDGLEDWFHLCTCLTFGILCINGLGERPKPLLLRNFGLFCTLFSATHGKTKCSTDRCVRDNSVVGRLVGEVGYLYRPDDASV